MSQTSNVLLVSGAAQMAFESLKKNATQKDLHDLGNGSVELLRDWRGVSGAEANSRSLRAAAAPSKRTPA